MGGLFQAARAAQAAAGSQTTIGGNDAEPPVRTKAFEDGSASAPVTAASENESVPNERAASEGIQWPVLNRERKQDRESPRSEQPPLPPLFSKALENYKAAPPQAQSSLRDDGGLEPRDYQNFENMPSQESSGKTGLPPLFDKTWEIYEEGRKSQPKAGPTAAVQPLAAPSPPAPKTGPAQSSRPTKLAPAQPAAPAAASIPIPAPNAPLRSDADMSALVDQRFKNTPIAGQWLKIKTFAQKHNVDPAFMLAIIAHETGFGANVRNNNPGGLMDSKNKSLTKKKFSTLDNGFDFMARTIASISRRSNNIADFAEIYAPSGGVANDPKNTNRHWPVAVPQYLREFSGR